ncbi:MAG: MFS transporter [Burkholderiales bacterium]
MSAAPDTSDSVDAATAATSAPDSRPFVESRQAAAASAGATGPTGPAGALGNEGSATPTSASTWSVLRHGAFRGLWVGAGIYFIGNAMQSMAAAWMMVEITGSAFFAALVQTAVFLPMFLLVLPAGVLADITDRRRLLLMSLVVQVLAGSVLAALSIAHLAGPTTLLLLIFVTGCCTALLSPAWNSTINDTLPRSELPAGITANGISYNAARALGPALAGLVFTYAGGAWNFVLAVIGTLVMLWSIRRWPPRPHPVSPLPAERLWGGILSALRFARHSKRVLAQLVRTVAYSFTGSALWALLPAIGQQRLDLDASGFGFLMGCLGIGAIGAGLAIGRIRAKMALDTLVAVGCVLYAAAMLAAAWSPWPALVYPALVLAGAAWMAVMSTFNTATQTSAPPWVRSRAVALHTLCALGSFALGSALWGGLSDVFGLSMALSAGAAGMTAGALLGRPFPLRMGRAQDVIPAKPWDDLHMIPDEPAPEAGPVSVEIGYRIKADQTAAFLEAVTQLRAPRRRDGATLWRLYRDLADPSRYVERFIVTSWGDYLRQRARSTQADQLIEARVRAFLQPGEVSTMTHYVAER